MYNILIKNGVYPDFASGEMVKANIGLKDGKIAYIGSEEPLSERQLDAEGKIVSPGFIDIHMHEENFAKEGNQYIISKLMLQMGVTTAVGGNCGVQYQPISEFRRVIRENGGCPVNYILLAGYNTFREKTGKGHFDAITEKEMAQIKMNIEGELAEGAWGISFGLEYDPGISYEEMLYAVTASNEPGHLVSAHFRTDCVEDIASVEEMVRFSAEIPQKFQISHLCSCSAIGKMKESLDCINEAMEKNPRLDFDTYPYNASCTNIGSAVFRDGCMEAWGKDYSCILLTDEPYKNVYCNKKIFQKVRKEYPDMLAVAFLMNEDEIKAAITNRNGMIASDAILNMGKGHPRAAGTFPRILGKYVREEKALSMPDALRKISYTPAERLGLDKKGRIEIGCDGDITIFDQDTIADRAGWTNLDPPVGIEYVIIKGKVAVENGCIVDEHLGNFIPYSKLP